MRSARITVDTGLLARLAADVGALRRRVDALEQASASERRTLHSQHRDVEFVRVLAAVVGGRAFSSVELLGHASVDEELAAALTGFMNAKQIGKQLRRLCGREIGGFVLERVGRDEHGTLWAFAVSAHLHAGAPSGDEDVRLYRYGKHD